MLLLTWENLSLLGKIYWIIAVPSTAIFFILLILSFFGADTDANIDGGDLQIDIHDGDVGLGEGFGGFIISFKSVMSFLMMFGWAGILSQYYNLNVFWTLFVAFVTGIIALFAVASLLYFITKMGQSGTLILENSIGKSGQVILSIPSKKQGHGQIQINVQGSLRSLDAVTEEPENIKSGTIVMVIELLEDNTLLVVPKR